MPVSQRATLNKEEQEEDRAASEHRMAHEEIASSVRQLSFTVAFETEKKAAAFFTKAAELIRAGGGKVQEQAECLWQEGFDGKARDAM